MSKLYKVYLIHKDQDRRAERLRRSLANEIRVLKLKPDLIRVETGAVLHPKADTVAVALFLGSAASKVDAGCEASCKGALDAGIPVFPLVDDNVNVTDLVPSCLHPFNALFWDKSGGPKGVVLHALRSLGLTEYQRRVFISYRRSDSMLMGEQLWSVLSQQGFQVFLDRFSLEPGARFQDKLFEALDEKSFVVLVESPDVQDSSWVEEEFNYARKRNMGLLVLTWPQTIAMKRTLPGVYEKYRLHLPPDELTVDSCGQGRLSQEFLTVLAAEVEERHAAALLRRRRQLMGSIESELKRSGVSYVGIADWSLVARLSRGGRARVDCVISITPRAPDVPDLLALDTHVTAGRKRTGVLVHTLRTVPQQRRDLLKWAIGRRKLKLVPEDQVVTFVAGLT